MKLYNPLLLRFLRLTGAWRLQCSPPGGSDSCARQIMFDAGLRASVVVVVLALRPLLVPKTHPTTPPHRRLGPHVETVPNSVLNGRLQI